MKYFLSVFSCLIIFCLATACSTDSEETQISVRDSVNLKYVGVSISLAEIMNKPSINTQTYINNDSKNKRLISFFDADCSSCLVELEGWSNFLTKNEKLVKDLDLIFIATSADSVQVTYLLQQQVKFAHPVFFVKDATFLFQNHLPMDKKYQTMLVDATNKVIFIGSPIKDARLHQEMIAVLKSTQM